MFGFTAKKNKNKAENINISADVVADISESSVIALCDEPSKNMPIPPIKHMAKFLKKENNIITLEIFFASEKKHLEYSVNDTASIVYYEKNNVPNNISLAKVYRISTRILKIRPACESDKLYIVELEIISKIKERHLREFYTADISFEVCFKNDFGDLTDENERTDNISYIHKRYIKFTTTNINSGGFSFRSKRYIEPEKIFECAILTGYEALSLSIKIVETELLKDGEDINKAAYIISAVFTEADIDIRTKLAKRIFQYQQKMRILRGNFFDLKKFYKKIHKK